ncbi:uncharacterized protein MONBRDRAFT_25119 [Monosiga brevicollis MX1]|uniref:EGF-like domain-containing protein n=1 Tax=Monosiga brevicollis TaxID=81824 RepID=A9UYG8_MONBE|nr:uncharacterized protein MONBRDRAFT_25119 [Monosiga brevicollis MX1]EDQ89459.1 predicted protein [Monosiga brevicollis MX1]|eukprot:XP_001745488.1 hypothetical protein [Monosiga brevicollis MX1]
MMARRRGSGSSIGIVRIILMMSLLAGSHAALQDLCYRLRWRLADPIPRERMIRPVTGFPPEHALVQNERCGHQYAAGDPIPVSALYSTSNGNSGCQEVTGGSLFYAYNWPNGASANTGFEEPEKALFYFVQREDSNVSFVLVHDTPGNADGGGVTLELLAPDLAGRELDWEVRDDYNEVYEYDSTTGLGRIVQNWAVCCTDGAALGPLPPYGYRITFRYSRILGLNGVRVGNYNASTNSLSMIELDLDDLADGIELTTFTCDQICEDKKSCGECASDDLCAWCGDECIYEDTLKFYDSCVSGSYADPTNELFCTSGDHGWRFIGDGETDQCDYPPGAINDAGRFTNPRITEVEAFCTGRGEPDFEVDACNCYEGYYGIDCRNECPGGAANPCSGHGVCHADGHCVCECGYGGTDCAMNLGSCSSCELSNGDACGILLTDSNFSGYCSGGEIRGPSCACLEGFHGEACNETCPGMSANGTGTSCGGHGTCDANTGVCVCDPCYTANPVTGLCEPKACPVCENDGLCVCDRNTGEQYCSCRGAFEGPTCNVCSCYNGGSCNAISGECICVEPYRSENCELDCTNAAEGELIGCVEIDLCMTNQSFCGANTTCTFIGYVAADGQNVTLGGDCRPVDVCAEEGEAACGSFSDCTTTGAGTYTCACQAGYWSDQAQHNCSAFAVCGEDELEAQAPTATSNRVCERVAATTTTVASTTTTTSETADGSVGASSSKSSAVCI